MINWVSILVVNGEWVFIIDVDVDIGFAVRVQGEGDWGSAGERDSWTYA